MAKQKTIPELKPRKRKMNASSRSSNTKSNRLKTVSPTTKKEVGASERTTLSPVAQPSKALHR